MELVPIKTVYGEEKSWDEICELDSADVSKRTIATFNKSSGAYSVECFGIEFRVFPCERVEGCNGSH